MCPLVFTRRKARRTAPTSSNDYPLYPIPNESSTARSAPPIPQGFPNLGISVTPAEAAHEAPAQHGSFSAGSGQGILGDIRNHPFDLLTALPQTAASDPSFGGESTKPGQFARSGLCPDGRYSHGRRSYRTTNEMVLSHVLQWSTQHCAGTQLYWYDISWNLWPPKMPSLHRRIVTSVQSQTGLWQTGEICV